MKMTARNIYSLLLSGYIKVSELSEEAAKHDDVSDEISLEEWIKNHRDYGDKRQLTQEIVEEALNNWLTED